MLGTDKYAIDNKKLLGRLLPFFARGRNLSGILLASISPIESLHKEWREWALDRIIESVATSQPVVLRWYLKKMLLPYMENAADEFGILSYGADYYIFIFEDKAEQNLKGSVGSYWLFEDSEDEANVLANKIDGVDASHLMNVRDFGEVGSDNVNARLIVVAPNHSSSISDVNYKRLIKQCIEKYLVYEMDYEIKTPNTPISVGETNIKISNYERIS